MDRRLFRRKRSDTKAGTIEATYGLDLGCRSDMKLRRILRETGCESLTELVRSGRTLSIRSRRSEARRENGMGLSRLFTSFDFDHDDGVRVLLVGQSRLADSPFEFADWSVKEHITGDWKEKVRARIRVVDQVLVLCGRYTHTATGVAAELAIAQEERKPYFLLKGYADYDCTRPTTARSTDKIYLWTWDNLKRLIGGAR